METLEELAALILVLALAIGYTWLIFNHPVIVGVLFAVLVVLSAIFLIYRGVTK